jgi:hypothetical protein
VTLEGTVQNGVVVLLGGQKLPEGIKVKVMVEPDAEGTTLSEELLKLAGTVEGLPCDLAENHDYYLHGHPKK